MLMLKPCLVLSVLLLPVFLATTPPTPPDAIDTHRFEQFQQISQDGWLPGKYNVFRSKSKMRVRNVRIDGLPPQPHHAMKQIHSTGSSHDGPVALSVMHRCQVMVAASSMRSTSPYAGLPMARTPGRTMSSCAAPPTGYVM